MAIDLGVNYVAILVAAIVSMVIGALWYSPVLFGNAWMKLVGFTQKDLEKAKKKGMGKTYLINFIAVLISAFVLAQFVQGAASIADGALVGFWIWLGFLATTMIGTILWENKPVQLYLINVSFYLVSLPVMGAIIAAMA